VVVGMSTPDELRFVIDFLGPFRVSTGEAAPGIDATVDQSDPLPATSLKGVMRATAKRLLGEKAPLVTAVFGGAGTPSPWHWSDAEARWHPPQITARVQLDRETHTANPDMLALAEETWAERAEFRVIRIGSLSGGAGLAGDPVAHVAVLAIAGRATRSLGAGRRRGVGWVHITCPDLALDRATVEKFLSGRTA